MLMIVALIIIVLVVTGGVVAGLVYLNRPQPQSSSDNSNGTHPPRGPNPPGGGGQGGTTPPARPPIFYKIWTDPTEGAFSVVMPDGWSASSRSGVVRPYFNAEFRFNATNSDGTISVFFAKNAFPDFVEPLPPTSFSCSVSSGIGYVDPLCTQGSWWTPIQGYPSFSAYVWPYVSAQDYAKSFFLYYMQRVHPGATMIASADRPDLAGSFVDLVLTQTQTGADALYSYTVNGVSYRTGIVVTTFKLNVNTYGGNPFTMWFYAFAGVSSPASDFSSGVNATGLYSQIIPTVRISKAWLQQEIQNQATNSRLISQTFSRIQQMDYRTFVDTSNSNYAVGKAWGDALGGVEDVTDSSGSVYTVDTPPLGYDYAWGDSSGHIVWTATAQSPGTSYNPFHVCPISGC
jgi:hypothetical protein